MRSSWKKPQYHLSWCLLTIWALEPRQIHIPKEFHIFKEDSKPRTHWPGTINVWFLDYCEGSCYEPKFLFFKLFLCIHLFYSTYTKIWTRQRRLTWPLSNNDMKICESLQIFFLKEPSFLGVVVEPRASWMLVKTTTTEPHPQAQATSSLRCMTNCLFFGRWYWTH